MPKNPPAGAKKGVGQKQDKKEKPVLQPDPQLDQGQANQPLQGQPDQGGGEKSDAPLGATGPAATGASAGSKSAPKAASIPGLEVTCKLPSFWRGGRQWTSSPTVVAVADLTEQQLELISNEPMLSVKEVQMQKDSD